MRYEETLPEAIAWNALVYNTHVILRKKFILWIAEKERKHLSQLMLGIELMLEINPEWQAEHVLQDDFDYDYYSS